MSGLIIGLVAALILVILFMLFRIQALITIAKGGDRPVGTSNKVNGALMLIVPIVLLALVAWYSPIAARNFLPEASSVHGVVTDNLFWVTITVISLMFLITNAGLFWFAYKYQYKEGRQASFFHDNTRLEVFWTIVPAVIMALLVFFGWKAWSDITSEPPKEAMVVEIMGKQFAWQVRYPGVDKQLGSYDFRLIDDVAGNEFGIDFEDKKAEDDFLAREMYLPKGQPVLFKIRARDVLHSVFAPHFRLKMDAVPGMPTQFHFVPTKTTEEMRSQLNNPQFDYEIACTEVCGRGHFAMKFKIVVVEPEEYRKWYAEQPTFLEQNPQFKGKGLSDLRKKNLAKRNAEQMKEQASL
ncbi:MAG: cytochrome c oxidase subunit II [Microscillaceae bacterium]|nr:cytochrome c oxidase subunit II [Microscillaceae bacterium]